MEISSRIYSEVFSILNLLSYDLLFKIPDEVWMNINEKRDKNIKIEIEDLENFEISSEAKVILAVLYKNYLSIDDEETIIKLKEYTGVDGETKEIKCDKDKIFSFVDENESKKIEQKLGISKYNDSIFARIKQFFKRNKI